MHQPIHIIHTYDTLLSDATKDAFGCRLAGIYQDWWTREQLEDEYERLERIMLANVREENAYAIECQQDLESAITNTIALGAGDRATALRWLYEDRLGNYTHRQSIEHELWDDGIGFGIIDMYVTEVQDALEVAA